MNEEAAAVQRAQRDPQSFGILYDRHCDRIYRYILGRTGNVQIAEDLTAETFLAALKNLWRFRFTGRPFRAWLYRIAVAQIGEYYRRRTPTIELELAIELPDLRQTEGAPILTDEYRQMHQALEQLSAGQHEAIVLRYFEDLPIADISWVMGIPESTVKSHLHRGLRHLHGLLPSDAYDVQSQPQSGRTLA